MSAHFGYFPTSSVSQVLEYSTRSSSSTKLDLHSPTVERLQPCCRYPPHPPYPLQNRHYSVCCNVCSCILSLLRVVVQAQDYSSKQRTILLSWQTRSTNERTGDLHVCHCCRTELSVFVHAQQDVIQLSEPPTIALPVSVRYWCSFYARLNQQVCELTEFLTM